MPEQINPVVSDYRSAITLLLEHHRLMRSGNGDTDAIEVIRDEVDSVWPALSEAQQHFLWELSADLYMLSDEETVEVSERGAQTIDLRAAMATALGQQDWISLLRYLREGPDFLEPHRIAYLRARAYDELDYLEVALEFIGFAAHLAPSNFDYRSLLVEMLVRSGQMQPALELANEHLANSAAPADLRLQAGSVLFLSTRCLSPEDARPVLERAVEELRRALAEAARNGNLVLYSAYGWVSVGDCYSALDNVIAARAAYDEALKAVPGFPLALAARAGLHAGQDLSGSIDELAHARPMVSTRGSHSCPSAVLAPDSDGSTDVRHTVQAV